MLGNVMGGLLKKVVQEVQKRNTNNPNVKTADSSVFENIMDRFKNRQQQADNPATSYAPSQEEFCDDLCNDLAEEQNANAANPNVETADSSVYDDMKAQIEALKAQMNANKSAPTINPMPLPNLDTPASPVREAAGMMATTNSNGGSLGFRTAPDMTAPMHNVRIPEFSKLKVLGYSDNSINLDGVTSRFAQVDYNGQVGWVLEAYLGMD
jgi:DNA-binding ferritin-like protein (Dps family)